ncbi:sigma factor [Streptomyces carpinensis]|uniref:Sigma factor n=1 Tax=Streptomyces carpinensis TaxID=66369 RepID=A0ABV1W7Z3_9ACTN|nr:sigma factor [Streptomyces carpinensis]
MKTLESHTGHPEQSEGRPDTGGNAAATFLSARPLLLSIGLRVLQDVGEAQDAVQETWLRWARTDRSAVTNPPVFLAQTTSRMAINVTQSARRRRETLGGPWLPETVDRTGNPEWALERHETVDGAIRLLVERLPAAERAVHLLRTAFDHPCPRISELLHLSEAYARQLLRPARRGGSRRWHQARGAVAASGSGSTAGATVSLRPRRRCSTW